MKYKYDYLGAMWEDIEESLNDYSNILERYNVTAAGGEMNGADFDEMFNGLYDAMWCDDSITGNGSGSYTFNNYRAREYVLDNPEITLEMFQEYGTDAETVGRLFLNEQWESLDVMIRCYILGPVLYDVLNEKMEVVENEVL